MSSLLDDVRFALRVMRRTPAVTCALAALLSVGIGANTAVFAIIHARLLKPLPYDEPARLMLARCTVRGSVGTLVSAPDYYDYREQADTFEGFSAVFPGTLAATVGGTGEPERVPLTFIAYDLFRTLGVPAAAGRWFTAKEGQPGGPPVVMIGERLAQERFGSARAAVGGTLVVDRQPFLVVGVMPADFRLVEDVDIWRPMRRGEAIASVGRQFHNWLIVARLARGVSREGAQSRIDVISNRLEQQYPDSNAHQGLQLDPLAEALAESYRPRLLLLMGAVAMVLLIACANVAGLQLARGSARHGELAIRTALGASRSRIVRLLLVESLALGLLSGCLGTCLAVVLGRLLPVAVVLTRPGEHAAALDASVLLFALAVSVLTGILAGIAPGLGALSRLEARGMARDGRSAGRATAGLLRKGLVSSQVAVSLVLLVGAGLLIRSFAYLASLPPGFEADRLLTGEVSLPSGDYKEPDRRIQFFAGLQHDIRHLPGVDAAGMVCHLPVRNQGFDLPAWDPQHPPAAPPDRRTAFRRVVFPGYFEAAGVPLLSGRDISRHDNAEAPRVMVVSERMARTLFPGADPLGRRVAVDMFGPQPTTFEVVGIVGDVQVNELGDGAPMTMYISYYQFPEMTMRFVIRAGQKPDAVSRAVRQLVSRRDKTLAVERLVPMKRILHESLGPQQGMAVLSSLLAGVAAVLAFIGLYALLSYWVVLRSREIGVRMALGASARDVGRLVLKQGLTLVSIGAVAGLVVAAGLSRLLGAMLYHVRPGDPLTFLVASLALLAVAAVATWVPARRAVRVQPMEALRSE